MQLILGFRLAISHKHHFHIENFKRALFHYMGREVGKRKMTSEYRNLNSKPEFCSQEGKMAKRHPEVSVWRGRKYKINGPVIKKFCEGGKASVIGGKQ